MKNNFFTNFIFIVLIAMGIYGIIAYLNIYSNEKDIVFESKIPSATPMSTLPLKITKKFGLYKTSNDLYYYGGAIYNSGNNEIIIKELRYTFEHDMRTVLQSHVETNICIPAKKSYILHDVPSFIVYTNHSIVDYAYVEITVNGEKQYLYHENYQSIVDDYNKQLNDEKEEFNKQIKQPLINSIVCMIFTGFISILLISSCISKKK